MFESWGKDPGRSDVPELQTLGYKYKETRIQAVRGLVPHSDSWCNLCLLISILTITYIFTRSVNWVCVVNSDDFVRPH